MRRCVECGRDLQAVEVSKYITAEGVLRCGHCAGGEGRRLDQTTYARLASLQAQRPFVWAEEFYGIPLESQKFLTELARRLVRRVLEKETRLNKTAIASVAGNVSSHGTAESDNISGNK